MTQFNKSKIQEALLDPAAVFGAPEVVPAVGGVSAAEKMQILVNWEDEVNLKMCADSENMGNQRGSDNSADLLKRIKKAERLVKTRE